MSEFPSKENQFKKGKSGNPAGRPKGSRNRSTIVRELLEAKVTDGEGQIVDQITNAIIQKALKGDVRAYKELMDSAYGKVRNTIESQVTYQQMAAVEIIDDNGVRKELKFNIGEEPR